MSAKMRSEEPRRIYAKGKSAVEHTYGVIKAPMGFGQSLLRGTEKVSTEWMLACTAYNPKRLWALKPVYLKGHSGLRAISERKTPTKRHKRCFRTPVYSPLSEAQSDRLLVKELLFLFRRHGRIHFKVRL